MYVFLLAAVHHEYHHRKYAILLFIETRVYLVGLCNGAVVSYTLVVPRAPLCLNSFIIFFFLFSYSRAYFSISGTRLQFNEVSL